jgi:hypothetical protein
MRLIMTFHRIKRAFGSLASFCEMAELKEAENPIWLSENLFRLFLGQMKIGVLRYTFCHVLLG